MSQCLAEKNIILKKSDFINGKSVRERHFNILKSLALISDNFGITIPECSQDLYKFFELRKKPLIEMQEDTFFVCYIDFLLDLFWSGTYYLILNSEDKISKQERDSFLNYLGDAFENYVKLITKDCFDKAFIEDKKINNTNTPLNDGVIQVNKDWILVIEAKGTREDKAMISGNNPLAAAYERIIARETRSGQKRKGIIQLAERINEFRKYNNFKGRITPLLVTGCKLRDVCGILSKIAWPEWKKELQKESAFIEFENCSQNDTPLIADIEDWERTLSLVKHNQTTLELFLEYRNDSTLKQMFLNDLVWSYIQEKNIEAKPYPLLEAEFKKFVLQLCQEVC